MYYSDGFTWSDQEEEDTARDVVNMINSPKSTIRKFMDGTCDVYEVNSGGEKKRPLSIEKMTRTIKEFGQYMLGNLEIKVLVHLLTVPLLIKKSLMEQVSEKL